MNRYQIVGYIASIAAPIPPAIVWGIEVFNYATSYGAEPITARMAALAAIITLESMPILSSYLIVWFSSRQRWPETAVSGVFMLAYLVIGVFETQGIGRVFFPLAVIVHFLVSFLYYVTSVVDTEATIVDDKKEERTQRNANRLQLAQMKLQLQHERKLKELQLQHAAQPAIVQPVANGAMQYATRGRRKRNGANGNNAQRIQQLVQQWQREGREFTRASVAKELGVHPSTVGRHWNEIWG